MANCRTNRLHSLRKGDPRGQKERTRSGWSESSRSSSGSRSLSLSPLSSSSSSSPLTMPLKEASGSGVLKKSSLERGPGFRRTAPPFPRPLKCYLIYHSPRN